MAVSPCWYFLLGLLVRLYQSHLDHLARSSKVTHQNMLEEEVEERSQEWEQSCMDEDLSSTERDLEGELLCLELRPKFGHRVQRTRKTLYLTWPKLTTIPSSLPAETILCFCFPCLLSCMADRPVVLGAACDNAWEKYGKAWHELILRGGSNHSSVHACPSFTEALGSPVGNCQQLS
jgi:hypothetical protein